MLPITAGASYKIMTQYDQIGAEYDVVDQQFFKLLESKVMENVLRPELVRPGLKLVEFAAGTGFYTKRAFAWSSSSNGVHVTSIDISPVMVDIIAQRNADKAATGLLRLITADGRLPRSYAPDGVTRGYFDGAFGGWFLNYAASRAELRAMMDCIAVNLKPGGFFVGVVPGETEDLEARRQRLREPPFDRLYLRLDLTRELDDGSGWWNTVHINEALSFEAAHHRKSVYEEVAREAGFGAVEWSSGNLDRDEFIKPGMVVQNDLSPEDYELYAKVGMFSVIKMYKE